MKKRTKCLLATLIMGVCIGFCIQPAILLRAAEARSEICPQCSDGRISRYNTEQSESVSVPCPAHINCTYTVNYSVTYYHVECSNSGCLNLVNESSRTITSVEHRLHLN